MNVFQAIVLGIIQGITEWLPISSSGHLVIAQEAMGIEEPLFFDAMVHLASLIVVVSIFRMEVLRVMKALFEVIRDLGKGIPLSETIRDDEHHLAILLVVGTIPTATIGLLFREQLESLYSNLFVVGIALIGTGIYLFFTKRIRPSHRIGIKEMSKKEALIIGTMQGIAIIPGVSRSGSTIATGIYTGLNKELVTRYSFILFIPAILGAAILQFQTVISRGESIEWIPTIAGMITSMIIGYISIKILLKVIRRSKLHLFSYYCWIVGILVLIYAILN